jgi:hypothetical protein
MSWRASFLTTSWVAASIAVIGALASSGGLLAFVKTQLPSAELALGVLSVLIAALAGAFSAYIARGTMQLRVTPRVFISYAARDQELATNVASALQSAGALVRTDFDTLGPGDTWVPKIKEAIEQANSVVFLVSTGPTRDLAFEVDVAQANNIPIVTAFTGDADRSSWSRQLHSRYEIQLNPNEPQDLDRLVQVVLDTGANRAVI